uniref:Uncharacterized protein n=1 Tax=Megaselia scalaris TaxID=36166 RepID=T1GF02_MEGSC
MWKLITLVFFTYLQLSNCYNKWISLRDYSQCEKESIIGPGSKYLSTYMRFQEFLPINSLVYGNDSQETRIKFYFQGRSHFGVAFLSQPKEPQSTEPIIYFEISCTNNFGWSYISLNSGETVRCDSRAFSNPMHSIYYTELEIVIDKQCE